MYIIPGFTYLVVVYRRENIACFDGGVLHVQKVTGHELGAATCASPTACRSVLRSIYHIHEHERCRRWGGPLYAYLFSIVISLCALSVVPLARQHHEQTQRGGNAAGHRGRTVSVGATFASDRQFHTCLRRTTIIVVAHCCGVFLPR